MKAIRLNHITLWIFLFCTIVVVLTSFFLLEPLLKFSIFSEDDWKWLLLFKSLPDPSIFSKIATIWTKIGIHEGGYTIYMGVLGDILGYNYRAYQYFNIIFKIISTLTVFPLVYILFKNRLLALLTTIFFGISSASTGSLYWYMKGGVFLGIALMNLFFISYYYTLIKNTKMLLFCSSLLIFLAYISSPTRIYPVFLIIVGVEIYWLINKKSLTFLKQSIFRLLLFLLPSIIIAMQAPISPMGNPHKVPFILLNQFLQGNLYNFLSPLAAMGYSLLTNGAWKYFGLLDYSTFASLSNYLNYLFRIIVIFTIILLFLAPILSKKPIKFIFFVFSLNFLLDILMFFIVNSYLVLPPEAFSRLDPSLFNVTKYPTFVAIFIIAISFTVFIEWLKDKKVNILTAVFIGPLFSLSFLIPMWISLGFLLDGYSSTQYYYQIPAIGMSLFISAILVLAYNRFKTNFLRVLIAIFIVAVIFYLFEASRVEINHEFLPIYPERIKVADQQILHDKLIQKLGDSDKEGNVLIFFELPKEDFLNQYYRRSLLLETNSFPSMINWRKYGKEIECVGNVSNKDILKSSFQIINDREGFLLTGKCTNVTLDYDPYFVTLDYQPHKVFFSIESLYAYKVVDGELIDIKDSLLKEIQYP